MLSLASLVGVSSASFGSPQSSHTWGFVQGSFPQEIPPLLTTHRTLQITCSHYNEQNLLKTTHFPLIFWSWGHEWQAVFQKVHNPAMAQPILTVIAATHTRKEPTFPCRKNAHRFKERSKPLMLHHGVVTSGRQHGLDGSFFANNFSAGLFSRSLKQDAITLLFVSYSWPLK